MEIIGQSANRSFNTKIEFTGKGAEFFGILLLNYLLTFITLGLYYPWAKVNKLRYVYGQTVFSDTRFSFHGTGKELFIGFIKVYLMFAALYGILLYGIFAKQPFLIIGCFALIYLVVMLLIPIAIHGMLRYRSSRTSWRGIHWGYRGNRNTLAVKFFLGLFLSIITLNIYLSWFISDLRKYIIGHIRFGSVEFSYEGKGMDLFLINLKGIIFSILTLGIYLFWYARNTHNYFVNNIHASQDGNRIDLKGTTTAGGYFNLLAGNVCIIVFTFGIGYAWTVMRSFRFFFSNLLIDSQFNPENITQTEEDYKNAFGEDVGDILDLGLI